MRIGTLKAICTATLFAGALPLVANQANVDTLKKEFAGVRALELPSHVASVVVSAKPDDRLTTAEDAIRAALAVNASSGPMVVGAISRANASVAAVSATTAAALQPRQVSQITRAAVGAAPSEIETIVTALTKAKPTSFYAVGVAAADVAPKSAGAILNGLSAASPALKTLIARAHPANTPIYGATAVATVLRQVQTMVATLSKQGDADALLAGDLTQQMVAQLPANAGPLAATGPTIGPPYTPGGSFGEIPATNTVETTGGRNYSSP